MKYSPYLHHSRWSSFIQFLNYQSIFLLCSITLVTGNACYSNSPTALTNNGDITLQVGQPLDLFCTISLETVSVENMTSENLEFQRDDQVIDQKYVTRVNKTTIRLYLENEEESNHMYYCFLKYPRESNDFIGDSMGRHEISELNSSKNIYIGGLDNPQIDENDRDSICWNLVNVGKGPKEVENIFCIVYNWKELNCSWDVPKNEFKTNYTIQFMYKGLYGEVSGCPNDDDVRNNMCIWTSSTKPPYYYNSETLKITITGVNVLDKIEQTFDFDPSSHLLVRGPLNLQLVDKTSTSILLKWNIGDMQFFNNTWIYKVLYMSIGSDWTSFICDSKNFFREREIVSCNVTNLTPNTLYDFRVYMKPQLATDKYWSERYASQIFRTKPSP